MKISIDLRSLSSGTLSGVENYTLNLLENMLRLDKRNQYLLFYNSLAKKSLPDIHYVNSEIKYSRYPNRFLNAALKFNFLKMEKLVGEFDWLFMPNLNQFSISPTAKLAITVHDLSPVVTPEFYDIKRRLWHKFLNYKQAFERANILFAVSEYTKKDLIRIFNVPPEKIKVVYPGIDNGIFNQHISVEERRRVRNLYSLPGDFILFLNTIEPRKNLAGTIKAFEKLKTPEFLIIAGRPGWKYQKDFKLIKQSKKSAKIRYIGYVEEKDKPGLLKLARALIYPSFYEGFGFQPLEALAVGTPVIASQVTSLPEVIGDAGLLVNPYDINSLADGLDMILHNEPLRQKLIHKGAAQALKFNWQTAAGQIVENFK